MSASGEGVGVRIRQIGILTRNIARQTATMIERLKIPVTHATQNEASHLQFGIRASAMLPVGDQFIELSEPDGTPSAAARHLERMGGHTVGHMLVLQVTSRARVKARALERGYQIVWEGDDSQITHPAPPGVFVIHLHPRDTGGVILSIAEAIPAEAWSQGGTNWREQVCLDRVTGIAACGIASRDPEADARRWADLLGLEPPVSTVLRLDGCELRFEQALDRPHAPSRLALRAASRTDAGELIDLDGFRFDLE